MKATHRPTVSRPALSWVLLSILLTCSPLAFSAPKILLNESVVLTDIDSAYLNQIFAMQTRKWPNGQAIQVFVLPSTDSLHRSFVVDHLQIQAHQLDRIWNRMLFTGTGKAPTVVESEEAMLNTIRATPGAIGYVSETFTATGVRVVGGGER